MGTLSKNQELKRCLREYKNYIEYDEEDYIRNCVILDDMRDTIDRTLIWVRNRGKEDSVDIFVDQYIPYVKNIITNDYEMTTFLNKGLDLDDLFQTGMIATIESMKKYDFRKNVKVRTYVNNMVRYFIKNYYRNFDCISVSREAKSIYYKYINQYNDFGEKISEERMNEMNHEFGISPKKLVESIMAVRNSNCLLCYGEDGNINCDEKTMNHTYSKAISDYYERYNKFTDYKTILECIEKLDPVEKLVIEKFYFCDITQKRIAYELNKSTSYISKVKNNAIKKIKKMIDEA